MRKVTVYSIVFLQTQDDLQAMCQYLLAESLSDVSDEDLIEYLSDWEQGPMSQYSSHQYDADQIDTEFLGYRIDKRRTKSGYLLSRNENLGYVGLSYFETV